MLILCPSSPRQPGPTGLGRLLEPSPSPELPALSSGDQLAVTCGRFPRRAWRTWAAPSEASSCWESGRRSVDGGSRAVRCARPGTGADWPSSLRTLLPWRFRSRRQLPFVFRKRRPERPFTAGERLARPRPLWGSGSPRDLGTALRRQPGGRLTGLPCK